MRVCGVIPGLVLMLVGGFVLGATAGAQETDWSWRIVDDESDRSRVALPLRDRPPPGCDPPREPGRYRYASLPIGDHRESDIVTALIKALGREKKPTVQRAIACSLERLTHRPFGEQARIWDRWWKRERETFRFPEPRDEKPPSPRRRDTGERRSVASFYGIPVDSREVIFVADQSASMHRPSRDENVSRWQCLLGEIAGVVTRLPRDARVNVIFFQTGFWKWRETLTPLSPKNRKALEMELARQRPQGGTDLYDGLAAALADPEVEAIYLLSDGEPTGGAVVAGEDILREVACLNRLRRAEIHCVSIGAESLLLRRLAEACGGRYVRR